MSDPVEIPDTPLPHGSEVFDKRPNPNTLRKWKQENIAAYDTTTPLTMLLSVMRDPLADPGQRSRAAVAAARYVHVPISPVKAEKPKDAPKKDSWDTLLAEDDDDEVVARQ